MLSRNITQRPGPPRNDLSRAITTSYRNDPR